MKNIFLALFLSLMKVFSYSQNIILNPGFELYYGCPKALGQVDSAKSWLVVTGTPDYYNCGLSTYPFKSNSTASSGTGFVGFAGDAGASESLGQYLSQPLLPSKTYTFSLKAKMTSPGGQGYNICAGVALYGYKSNMPLKKPFIHPSKFPGSLFLGKDSIVRDTVWRSFSFSFTPTDTINAVVITMQDSMQCYQNVFVDEVDLRAPSNSINNFKKELAVKLSQDANGHVYILCEKDIEEIKIFNLTGQIIFQSSPNEKDIRFRLDNDGINIVCISSGGQVSRRKLIVTR